jgi:hypothetical protein
LLRKREHAMSRADLTYESDYFETRLRLRLAQPSEAEAEPGRLREVV